MTKIQVSETRVKATADRVFPAVDRATVRAICIAFAENLALHPIVPTDEQIADMDAEYTSNDEYRDMSPTRGISVLWQRRMFLAEPEIPEEVKDLIWSEKLHSGDGEFYEAIPTINAHVIEAFRRGQRSKG